LINFFHVLLYQIEAKEFLEIIGNAISEDTSKVGKAKKRFEEIVRDAKQMQEEFENYKEEEDIDSDDDEGLDDFLNGLGITRPK
jgi:Ran GTPase-activating protein (RanGAP) involved in mRNA processing and transport